MVEVYDLILSREIREHLIKENYVPDVEEKVEIVCGSLCPIEDKYETLRKLLTEAESQDDREEIEKLLGLYSWAIEELHTNRPGQVFVFMEYQGDTLDDVLGARFYGVEHICRTYHELQNYLTEYGEIYGDQVQTAKVEKWVETDGKMREIMDLHICADHGRTFIDRFDISWEQCKAMGISYHPEMTGASGCRTTIPLPFQHGDFIRIDIPRLEEPVYGVLHIHDALGRYMFMAYIEDHCLKNLAMSYQDFDTLSGWRVIDWTHPAQPSELPDGQELLVEISDFLRRADLNPEEAELARHLFYCRPIPLISQTITLSELMEKVRHDKVDFERPKKRKPLDDL